MEILPAILAKDEAEFIAQVERVRALGLPLHIDVMDGKFVPQTTWAPSDRVRDLLEDIPYEVHLMTVEPEHDVPVWLATDAIRVIFHVESTHRESLICRSVGEKECARLVLALNPETPISEVVPFIDEITQVMVMGVAPGASGQSFKPEVLEKLAELARLRPGLTLAIDGGMSPATCPLAKAAGATRIIAGNALTGSPDPTTALTELRTALEN